MDDGSLRREAVLRERAELHALLNSPGWAVLDRLRLAAIEDQVSLLLTTSVAATDVLADIKARIQVLRVLPGWIELGLTRGDHADLPPTYTD